MNHIKKILLLINPTTRYLLTALASVLMTSTILNRIGLLALGSANTLLFVVVSISILALVLHAQQHISNKRSSWFLAIFSSLMSTSVVLGDKINLSSTSYMDFVWLDISYWISWVVIIFCSVNFVLLYARRYTLFINRYLPIPITSWLKISAILFVFWAPYFLVYFPGILNSDTSDQLTQALGGSKLNDQHPVLIAFFMSLFARLGLLLSHSYYVAIAFITLAQMLIAASVLGYVATWINTRFPRSKLYTLTIAFFGIFPIIPYFVMTVGKDTFFALAILLLTTAIYDLVISNGTIVKQKYWLFYFAIILLLVMLTRNNGMYVIIPTSLCIISAFRVQRRRLVAMFTVVFTILLLIKVPLYTALDIHAPSSTEPFGILLQQVARTVALDGNLSDSDRQMIGHLLPLEKWRSFYSPSTPDRLKFCYTAKDACMNNAYLNDHQSEFLHTWASIGLKNPRIYLEAALTQNSGFWHIGSPDDYGSFKSDEKKFTNGSTDLVRSTTGIHASGAIYKTVRSIRDSPLGVIINQGSLIWAVLFVWTTLLIRRYYKMLLPTLPVTFLWMTLMLAAPAMSFRYSLATFLTLPVLLVVLLAKPPSTKT